MSQMNCIYQEPFAETIPPDNPEKIMNTKLQGTFPSDFKEVWSASLNVLTQHAIIPYIKQIDGTSGMITYIELEALPQGYGIFWADLPFSLYIKESTPKLTDVYIRPKVELLANKYPAEQFQIIEKALNQRGQKLLFALANQIRSKNKWEYLKNK